MSGVKSATCSMMLTLPVPVRTSITLFIVISSIRFEGKRTQQEKAPKHTPPVSFRPLRSSVDSWIVMKSLSDPSTILPPLRVYLDKSVVGNWSRLNAVMSSVETRTVSEN